MSCISILIYSGYKNDALFRTVASALNCGCEVEVLLAMANDSEMVSKITQMFPSVKLISAEKQGCAAAMRKMFELSSGDYVMPLESGVMLFPGAIVGLQQMLNAVPAMGGAYGLHIGYDAAVRRMCFVEGGPISYFRLFEGRNFPRGSILMRRSSILAAGGILAIEPGWSPGWDYFLYYRVALVAPFGFSPQPISHRQLHEERLNPFHHGKDCRNTLLDSSAAIVATRAREWFKDQYRELMRKIMSGENFSGENLSAIMVALGLVAEMTKPGSRDAETIVAMAKKLGPDDFGSYWFDVEHRMKGGDWQRAIKQADEMFNRFYHDSWLGRKALNLKRKIMGNAGAPQHVIAAFDTATADYLKSYYLTADTCSTLETWMENERMRQYD